MKLSGDAVGKHLRWMTLAGLAEGTVAARRRALTRLQAGLPCPLLAAGPAELMAWREGMRLAPVSVKTYVSHVRQFYAWALAEGLIKVNPVERVPVPKVGRRLPRPIGEADLLRALAAAPPRIRAWLVLAAWAGLRAKEIALLRRENILDTGRRPAIRIAGDATKGRRERIVPMSVFVRAELRRLDLPPRGWVFRRLDGRLGPNQPWRVSALANQFLHAHGIPETLHQLRHRFGTMAYQAGGRDLRAVQELMGHADPATTAGYAAYDQVQAAAAVEAIPAPGLHPVQEEIA